VLVDSQQRQRSDSPQSPDPKGPQPQDFLETSGAITSGGRQVPDRPKQATLIDRVSIWAKKSPVAKAKILQRTGIRRSPLLAASGSRKGAGERRNSSGKDSPPDESSAAGSPAANARTGPQGTGFTDGGRPAREPSAKREPHTATAAWHAHSRGVRIGSQQRPSAFPRPGGRASPSDERATAAAAFPMAAAKAWARQASGGAEEGTY